MATLKFKTNAKCGGCVAAIGAKLNKLVKEDAWSIDLKSPDKTLTITTGGDHSFRRIGGRFQG